jgi:hypothetical protein
MPFTFSCFACALKKAIMGTLRRPRLQSLRSNLFGRPSSRLGECAQNNLGCCSPTDELFASHRVPLPVNPALHGARYSPGATSGAGFAHRGPIA